MNKRIEEAALKAYPKEKGKMWASTFGTFEFDRNASERKGFQEGYEQAEKDMKERFIQFVHRHYPLNYLGWIQDFEKAMEEEE